MFDAYIAAAGIDAPSDDRRPYDDFMPTTATELDLDAAGVGAVVWATGYQLDFGWVDVPMLDQGDTRDTSGGSPRTPWAVRRRPALAAQPALLGARRCGGRRCLHRRAHREKAWASGARHRAGVALGVAGGVAPHGNHRLVAVIGVAAGGWRYLKGTRLTAWQGGPRR
jgi:hypothetical protein